MKRLMGLCGTIVVALGCGTSDNGSAKPAPTSTPDKADAGPVDAGPPPLAEGLTIREVAVFQAVKVGVAKDGARVDKRSAPVIANRPGLLRAYVNLDPTWKSHQVIAELHLWDGDKELPVQKSKRTFHSSSVEAELTTTFNFDLTAETVPAGVAYSIVVRDPAGMPQPDADSPARYPTDGSIEDLGASASTPQVRIKLVPVQYNGDNSGRLPDMSDDQIEQYRSTLFKMYPTAKIDITVRDSFAWAAKIEPDGTGWDDFVQALIELRIRDKAAPDIFYVGVFDPARNMNSYCTGGCVLGIAPLATVSDVEERIAVVAGFAGLAENTLLQELAHAMGREHAPCGGADGPDKKYPYAGAGVGVWGYDSVAQTLIDPDDKYRDIMGYCEPQWISDYTYKGLYDRIAAISRPKRVIAESSEPQPYRFVSVAGNGALKWGRSVTLENAPHGESVPVSYHGAMGNVLASATGHYFAYDSLPGGFMLVPAEASRFVSISVRGLGGNAVLRLSR